MNKFIGILIGLFLVALAIKAMITGECLGFSAGYTSGHRILFNTHPIEFSLKTMLELAGGLLILRESLPDGGQV